MNMRVPKPLKRAVLDEIDKDRERLQVHDAHDLTKLTLWLWREFLKGLRPWGKK